MKSGPLKILHTVARYHPDNGGGATEVVRQISERLAARGHDVTVATTASPARTEFELGGVKIRQFDIHPVMNHSAIGIRGKRDEFTRFLRESDFDVVLNYAAQTWHVDLTCEMLGRIPSKTILAACGYSGLHGLRRLLYWRYFQRLPDYLRRYDAVVYHSAEYQDKQFGDLHGVTNFEIIPNGVSAEEFETAATDFRARYSIDTPHMLLSVGDHFTNKGHAALFEAFERLGRDDTTLVLIGRDSAPWFRSCAATCRKVAAASRGRIRVLERVPRADVAAAYRTADLFLFTSRIEAFPLVILEAMASRTPWISFPAGNVNELAGGVVVRGIDAMAAETKRLLDDAAARSALADTGHDVQRRLYSWDAVVDRYEALYRR